MKTIPLVSSVIIALALLAGCDSGKNKRAAFVFPQGDVTRGQTAFITLNCYECHRVDGVPGLPAPKVASEKVVLLGGEVALPRTYGELITAVIHPAYERTIEPEGPVENALEMPDFNRKMSVAQMLDIVTFLKPHYRRLRPLYYDDYYGP